jgi:hypothetical protein
MPARLVTVRAGSRSRLLHVHTRTADGATPMTGLTAGSAGARAAYIREGEPRAVEVRLSAGAVGEWSPGGFVEVDAALLPGVYQFGAPDELLAPGSQRALLVIRFDGVVVDPVDVDLVAFDPQDTVRLGLTALGPEARVEALRGAFPRLAAKEIEERTAVREAD